MSAMVAAVRKNRKIMAVPTQCRRGRASRSPRRTSMWLRNSTCAGVLAVLLIPNSAQAFDDSKYPDLRGQWVRGDGGMGRYDPTRPPGRGQQAPLTPEYRAIHEASLADQAAGGQGDDPTYRCISPGMPRIMHAYSPMEIVVTPEANHILIEHIRDNRRIYTDG